MFSSPHEAADCLSEDTGRTGVFSHTHISPHSQTCAVRCVKQSAPLLSIGLSMTVHHFNPQSVHSSTQLSRIFVPKVYTLWPIFILCLLCVYGVYLADEIPKKKKNQPDKMRTLFFWVSPCTANSNDATCAFLFFISLIMLCVLYPFTPIFIKLSVSVYSTYDPPRLCCSALFRWDSVSLWPRLLLPSGSRLMSARRLVLSFNFSPALRSTTASVQPAVWEKCQHQIVQTDNR